MSRIEVGPFTRDGPPISRRWLAFAGWLLGFYLTWGVFVHSGGLWPTVRAHWPIAVAMAGGSFVGGSSPVAGGTVGFPVLVYVLGQPASLGKTFSLAIQSIGMLSASFFLLACRRRVEWRMLRFALVGSLVGMPVGLALLAPSVSDGLVKIVFSVLYASFGLLHLARMREIVGNVGATRTRFVADPAIGFFTGLLGGLLASVIGVGADILLYGVLVLLYHADIRVAIPTAVMQMAFTSLIGLACTVWRLDLDRPGAAGILEIVPFWLAAAPVVVLGGPMGSLFSRHVPRRAMLGFVALLCLWQYAWTCHQNGITSWRLGLATLGVLALNLGLHMLYLLGRRSLPLRD